MSSKTIYVTMPCLEVVVTDRNLGGTGQVLAKCQRKHEQIIGCRRLPGQRSEDGRRSSCSRPVDRTYGRPDLICFAPRHRDAEIIVGACPPASVPKWPPLTKTYSVRPGFADGIGTEYYTPVGGVWNRQFPPPGRYSTGRPAAGRAGNIGSIRPHPGLASTPASAIAPLTSWASASIVVASYLTSTCVNGACRSVLGTSLISRANHTETRFYSPETTTFGGNARKTCQYAHLQES